VFLNTVEFDQRAEPPTDWFIIQTARLLLPMTLLFAKSVVLAWLPQSHVSNRHHEATTFGHVCCLGMVAPIRCEQQLSWGYWRMILLAISVVSSWLSQSDVSNVESDCVTLQSLLFWIRVMGRPGVKHVPLGRAFVLSLGVWLYSHLYCQLE
jgi:hypothetical protein